MQRLLVPALLVAIVLSGCGLESNGSGVARDARSPLEREAPGSQTLPPVAVTAAPVNVPVEAERARVAPIDDAVAKEKGAIELLAAPREVEKSALLARGFWNPMPGGVLAGYRGDTGLDIAGSPRPVYAIAAGTLDYAEHGHTLWTGPRDTANTIRIELDTPIPYKGRLVTHIWYAHLSELAMHQEEGATDRRHVEAGERLGVSGVARGSPHLHLGMLLDRDVTQYWGTFLLEDEIRDVLGGLRAGQRLPQLKDETSPPRALALSRERGGR
jgi:murein DD-endopeptidase MepM/ murein hydrolase activator NlpD